jgi:hypothetical protein
MEFVRSFTLKATPQEKDIVRAFLESCMEMCDNFADCRDCPFYNSFENQDVTCDGAIFKAIKNILS